MKRPEATRSSLARSKKRLVDVERGRDLLSKKREALVLELFELAEPARDARRSISARAQDAYLAYWRALSLHGRDALRAIGRPERDITVEVRAASRWGMQISELTQRSPVRRTVEARGTEPGTTGPAAVEAADQLETLVELLLDAAPRETAITRLGEALANTSRKVNVLGNRVAPNLSRQIETIRSTLEEHEREERVRLRHLLRRRRK
jgi:H(+)-transporting ATP synthase subunit D